MFRGCGGSVPAKPAGDAPLSAIPDGKAGGKEPLRTDPGGGTPPPPGALKRQNTYSYNREQKSLDEKVMEGSLQRSATRGRRAGVSAEAATSTVSGQSTRVTIDSASQVRRACWPPLVCCHGVCRRCRRCYRGRCRRCCRRRYCRRCCERRCCQCRGQSDCHPHALAWPVLRRNDDDHQTAAASSMQHVYV